MKSLKLSHEAALPEPPRNDRPAPTRRTLLDKLGIGAILASTVGLGYGFLRSLVPNVLYEPPRRFKIGSPERFPEGATYLEDSRLFVFRDQRTFQAMSAVCTHLGCTVKMVTLNQPQTVMVRGQRMEEQREFHCPCHGSKYYGDGTNYAGPAPRPLARYRLDAAPDDGQLIVDVSQPVDRNFRLTI
jgi:menaquinol-cytochrome c reductase iron-sulfur subunit